MDHPPVERAMDGYLVLACRSGSRVAFEALHQRWSARLRAHAARLLGREQRHAVEDVCQDAWLDVARGLARLAEPSSFGSWAMSIVTRRAADQHRRQRREPPVVATVVEPHAGDNAAAAGDDERDALRRALTQLSRDDRALLHLFYIDQLTVAETAQALGVPVGTVKSRLFQARQRLRRELQRSAP